MTDQRIWGNLGRAVNDPTLIDEAIATAVQAHGDDPDAHLELDQSLNSHRAAQIIDHLAESVVNDKLSSVARAYTAIVGSGLAGDFDTIESAHAYCVAQGGGNIFITPGNYYLSGKIELDGTVNFFGSDRDTTTIHTDYANGQYFETYHWSNTFAGSMKFDNLQFIAASPVCVSTPYGITPDNSTIYLTNCIFRGAGNYLNSIANNCYLTDTIIELSTTEALTPGNYTYIENLVCLTVATTGTLIFLDGSTIGELDNVIIDNIISRPIENRPINWFKDGYFAAMKVSNSTLTNFISSGSTFDTCMFNNVIISLNGTGNFSISGSNNLLTNNIFYGGSGNRLRLASDCSSTICNANIIGTSITNSGTNNLITGNL